MIIRPIRPPYYTRVSRNARCPECSELAALVTRYYRDPD
jgi:hypothetical protein